MQRFSTKIVYLSLGDIRNTRNPLSFVYRIDPYSVSGRNTLYSVLTKEKHIGYGFTSFETKLYAVGGDDELKGGMLLGKSDTVFVCETALNTAAAAGTSSGNQSCFSWEKTCPTILSRLYPILVSSGDRLFLFGRYKEDSLLCDAWAEVFHPHSKDTWNPLYPIHLPFKEDGALIQGIVVLEEEKSLILATLDKGVMRLDYSGDTYKWYHETTQLALLDRWCLRTAVVDRTIYVYRHDSIAAYDRDEDRWSMVDGLVEYLPIYLHRKLKPPGSLFHLKGNTLFLIWAMVHREDSSKMELHWVRFQVVKISTRIHAAVEASGIYDVDGQVYYDACLTCAQESQPRVSCQERTAEDDFNAIIANSCLLDREEVEDELEARPWDMRWF